MQVEVTILGAAGFGGGELLRLLANHPAVASLQAVSASHAGQPVTAAHPHLHNLGEMRFVAKPQWKTSNPANRAVVFSAMPHGELAKQYAEINSELKQASSNQPALLIDLSGDFRLTDAETFQSAYGYAHPCPEQLGSFVYGLPEHNGAAVSKATRIANPGCFATAINLALLPFAGVDGLGLLAVSGVTGSSGSGVIPGAYTHHPTRANDFRAYKMLQHQHLAEVEQLLTTANTAGYDLSFVPHSAPLVRGIFVTVQMLLPRHTSAKQAEALIHDCYEHSKFVQVMDGSPRVATTLGSNFAEVGYAFDGNKAVVMCALDNLGKGMAGQAIQNMNLALRIEEATGISNSPVYP